MRKLAYIIPTLASFVAMAQNDATTITSELASTATDEIGNLHQTIAPILVAAFGIAVGFVAYKLIKRALNKA